MVDRSIWKEHVIPWFISLFIIAILAGYAIPKFLRFQSRPVQVYLGEIYDAQKEYFLKHHTYASGENCFALLGWHPYIGRFHSFYCDTDKILCNRCKEECVTTNLSAVSARGFTIMASGNVDNDPGCDVWTMNDAKVIEHVVDDVAR
ncbi:MAG TPA: hypothetical protein VM658_10155 [bacterium]|nr:hypothetical protein [bacterium]